MKNKSKLSFEEYQEIYIKYESLGWGVRQISRYLGRSASSISRFLRRSYDICQGVWKLMTPFEKANYAWQQRKKRRSRLRLRLKSERVRCIVVFLLSRKHWSPEDIARFLTRHCLKISAKSIYNFIKAEKRELIQYLKLRGKQRRQRVVHPRSFFKKAAPEKKNIRLRPEIIEEGHWEIDTIHSKKGTKSGVLTLKERKSLKAYFFLIEDRKARTVVNILLPFFQSLPENMCKTLTADNGSEFEELYKLEKVVSEFSVYYCDPYKSWQKGAVENSNGELRWYFPKGTDFSEVSPKEFRNAVAKINGKPRQSLNDMSATYTFSKLSQVA